MIRTLKASLVIAAAIAGISFTSSAMAQQRVGGNGHALDANNQVGSGGTNQATQQPQNLGNQIASGHVTGLFGFQGRTSIPDQLTLGFGNVAGSAMQQFIARSSGPNDLKGNTLNPYYSTLDSAAPTGYVQSPFNQSYVPVAPPTNQPEDLRLDSSLSMPNPQLPGLGQLAISGQVDPSPLTRGMITASPLFGVRQWSPDMQRQAQYMFASETPVGAEESGSPSQNRIDEIRRELLGNIVPSTPGAAGALAPNGQAQPLTSLSTGAIPIAPQPLTPTVGETGTSQGSRMAITAGDLPAPDAQSTQYKALLQNIRQYQDKPMTDQQAANQFNLSMKMIKDFRAQQQNAGNNVTVPTTHPSITPRPQAIDTHSKPAAPGVAPVPLTIKSISDGISSPTLKDTVSKAEEGIRQKRYSKAVVLFDSAAEAAPNNPLIVIGRAQAEIAGEFWHQADADVRNAFNATDHATLLAQFNLNDLIGDERMKLIMSDLTKFAVDEPENPTPAFLLAYVYYNSNDPDRIEKTRVYLNQADKRSGGKDPAVALMKKYWWLSDKAAPKSDAPKTEEKANEPLKITPQDMNK